MQKNNTEYMFLLDLVTHLIDKSIEVKQCSENEGEFEKGQLFSLYEVLSLIYQQAIAFGIDPSEIGMKNFNPDTDIL